MHACRPTGLPIIVFRWCAWLCGWLMSGSQTDGSDRRTDARDGYDRYAMRRTDGRRATDRRRVTRLVCSHSIGCASVLEPAFDVMSDSDHFRACVSSDVGWRGGEVSGRERVGYKNWPRQQACAAPPHLSLKLLSKFASVLRYCLSGAVVWVLMSS